MAGRNAQGLRVYGGAVAFITGGASGIGEALARELARRGAEVVVGDRQGPLAEEVAASIRESGGKATAIEVDVRDAGAVQGAVQATFNRTGRLDFLFNNAGIAAAGTVGELSLEAWDNSVDVNLRGVIHGVHAAHPIFAQQGFGHIVNTASMAGLLTLPMGLPYATTKHAVVGMSKSMRAELAGEGIRVSVLCPGVIRTPILTGGKFGHSPEDISEEVMLATWERLRPISPERFASRTLDLLARNQAIVIVPGWWRLAWWAERFFPTLTWWVTRKNFEHAKRTLRGTKPA